MGPATAIGISGHPAAIGWVADAAKAGRKSVLVQITRDDTNRFVALPVARG